MSEPTCGKCGEVMTRENAKHRPELFLHDRCLPPELQPPPQSSWSTLPASEQERLGRVAWEAGDEDEYVEREGKRPWNQLPDDAKAQFIRIARAVWEAACK